MGLASTRAREDGRASQDRDFFGRHFAGLKVKRVVNLPYLNVGDGFVGAD
jgi:hypothetical protein